MIRSELCEIAKFAVPTFNSHRRNDNLPFVVDQSEATDGTGKTWARFDLYDATMLIAAQNLSLSQGVTWSEAARILREKPIFVSESVTDYFLPGFHCARIEFLTEGGQPPTLRKRFEIYRGSLPRIIEAADLTVDVYNLGVNFASDRIALFNLVSVNLSQACVIARTRAAQLGIDVSSDFSPDPLAEG